MTAHELIQKLEVMYSMLDDLAEECRKIACTPTGQLGEARDHVSAAMNGLFQQAYLELARKVQP